MRLGHCVGAGLGSGLGWRPLVTEDSDGREWFVAEAALSWCGWMGGSSVVGVSAKGVAAAIGSCDGCVESGAGCCDGLAEASPSAGGNAFWACNAVFESARWGFCWTSAGDGRERTGMWLCSIPDDLFPATLNCLVASPGGTDLTRHAPWASWPVNNGSAISFELPSRMDWCGREGVCCYVPMMVVMMGRGGERNT